MRRIIHIVFGCVLAAIGLILFKHSFIVTGGTAGLSLSASYFFNLPFAVIFFLVNIPFYVFSIFTMGWRFTVSSILSVSLLSTLIAIDMFLPSFTVPIWFGAIAGGLIIGYGLSLIFMNGSSLGGVNILALFLQRRFNIDPGKTNFIFDAIVVVTGLYTVGLVQGFFSIVSIAIIGKVVSYYRNEIAQRNKPKAKETTNTKTLQVNTHVPVTR